MASTSLTAIIREVAEGLYPGRRVLGATTSSVDASSVLDSARLINSDANINQYNGVMVRVDEKTASGPPIGEYRRVTNGGFAGATGDLTTAAFTQTIESGMDFSLHRSLLPTELEKYANLILSQCHHRALHPLSIITNHDYENESGATKVPDNWTQDGSATLVQSTDNVIWGRYSAKLAAGADDDYWKSDALMVTPCKEYTIWAPVHVVTGNAELIAWDLTAGEEIDKGVLVSGPGEFAFTFSIPADCVSMEIRLAKSLAASEIYWGPVYLAPRARTLFDLPSWMTTKNHLIGAVYLPLGMQTLQTDDVDAYMALERRPEGIPYKAEMLPLHANPRRVYVDPPALGPVMIRAWRPFAELTEASGASGASPTTEAEHNTIIAGVLGLAHEAIGKLLANSDPVRSRQHLGWAAKETAAYLHHREAEGYAVPESKLEVPRATYARLQ